MAEQATSKNPQKIWITLRSGNVFHSSGLGALELITRAIDAGEVWAEWIDEQGKEQRVRVDAIDHVGEVSDTSGDDSGEWDADA